MGFDSDVLHVLEPHPSAVSAIFRSTSNDSVIGLFRCAWCDQLLNQAERFFVDCYPLFLLVGRLPSAIAGINLGTISSD